MSRSPSHRFGTRTAGMDVQALRGGLASPGMDTRYWISRGTVGTVTDDGDVDYSDPHAVWIGPEGVECDVILEPLVQRVTAVWAGGMAGEITDLSPIHPGDQVVVECPDGDLMTPVIIAILNSRANKQPMKNGKPLFDNKRRLIYAKSVPIDIRTAGSDGDPVQYLIEQDGTVTTTATRINHGDADVSEQFMLGTSYRKDEQELFDGLTQGLAAMQAAAVGPMAGFQPGLASAVAALQKFKAAAAATSNYLSKVNYGK